MKNLFFACLLFSGIASYAQSDNGLASNAHNSQSWYKLNFVATDSIVNDFDTIYMVQCQVALNNPANYKKIILKTVSQLDNSEFVNASYSINTGGPGLGTSSSNLNTVPGGNTVNAAASDNNIVFNLGVFSPADYFFEVQLVKNDNSIETPLLNN
jgi:hypothetical protein